MASLACGHEAAAGSGNPRLCRPSIYLAPSQLRLRTLSSPRLHRHPSHPSSKAAPPGSASWAVTTLLEGTALRLTPPRPVRLARLYLQHIKQRPEGQPPPPPHRIAWPSGRGLTAQETEAQRKPVQVGEPKLKPRPTHYRSLTPAGKEDTPPGASLVGTGGSDLRKYGRFPTPVSPQK